jgi:penicillin-binding protein 2
LSRQAPLPELPSTASRFAVKPEQHKTRTGKTTRSLLHLHPAKIQKSRISVVCENAGFGSTWAAPIASLMIEQYLKRKTTRKDLEERMINGNLINGKIFENERTQGNISQD